MQVDDVVPYVKPDERKDGRTFWQTDFFKIFLEHLNTVLFTEDDVRAFEEAGTLSCYPRFLTEDTSTIQILYSSPRKPWNFVKKLVSFKKRFHKKGTDLGSQSSS